MIEAQQQKQTRTRDIQLDTGLATATRLEVLTMQIAYIIGETTQLERIRDILTKGMQEHRWITRLVVEAYDQREVKFAEITIHVDWERWKINIISNGNELFVNRSAPEGDQISVWINEIVQFFNRFTSQRHLTTRCVFTYIDEVNRDSAMHNYVNQILGLKPTQYKPWAPGKEVAHVLTERPARLNECTVSLSIAP